MKALVYSVSAPHWVACKLAGLITPRAFTGPLSMLRLRDVPVPPLPGPGWVRIRTILGGVCGTDLALIFQRNHPNTILQQFATFPAVLGHENVGIIEEVGAEVPDHWQAGMRVCADPAIGCLGRGIDPPCPHCAAGRPSVCEAPGDVRFPPRALLGLNRVTGGSWSEAFVAHHSQLHRVPDNLPDEHAVLVDPLASAAHAVFRRPPHAEERVLIVGSGIVAFGVLAAIRALGNSNRVTVIVRSPHQADLARQLGATTALVQPRSVGRRERYGMVAEGAGATRIPGRMGNQVMLGGYDLTYDCIGTPTGLTEALAWTRPRGTLVAVGTSGISMLDSTPIWFDELNVIGASGRQIEETGSKPRHTYEIVFEWLTTGRINAALLAPRRVPLADYRDALLGTRSRGPRPLKIAFDPTPAR